MVIYIRYNLEQDSIKYTSFEEIEKYDIVVYINCWDNQLNSLPKLPNSLQNLQCSYNKLTSLPKLPNSLLNFTCYYNELTLLPELPNSLHYLYCYCNKFIKKQSYKYLKQILYL